jgi:hypothetical protein
MALRLTVWERCLRRAAASPLTAFGLVLLLPLISTIVLAAIGGIHVQLTYDNFEVDGDVSTERQAMLDSIANLDDMHHSPRDVIVLPPTTVDKSEETETTTTTTTRRLLDTTAAHRRHMQTQSFNLPERSLAHTTLSVVFMLEADDLYDEKQSANATGLFSENALRRMRLVEEAITSSSIYQQHCVLEQPRLVEATTANGTLSYRSQTTEERRCHAHDSALNFFYPSVDVAGDTLTFDGRGTELAASTDDVVMYLLQQRKYGFTDRRFRAETRVASIVVARFTLGYPLTTALSNAFPASKADAAAGFEFARGVHSSYGKGGNFQTVLIDDALRALQPTLSAWNDRATAQFGFRVLYSDDRQTLTRTEVQNALRSDIAFVVVSIVVVFLVMWLSTRSLFIAATGMLQIAASFPVALLIYRAVFGATISMFSVVSLWFMLGVGADDIFVICNSWRLYSIHVAAASTSSSSSSSSLTAMPADVRRAAQLRFAFREGIAAMTVTSATTAAAFFASCVSRILPLRQFGFYMGVLVCVNYLLAITWVPCCLMLYHKYEHRLGGQCQRRNGAGAASAASASYIGGGCPSFWGCGLGVSRATSNAASPAALAAAMRAMAEEDEDAVEMAVTAPTVSISDELPPPPPAPPPPPPISPTALSLSSSSPSSSSPSSLSSTRSRRSRMRQRNCHDWFRVLHEYVSRYAYVILAVCVVASALTAARVRDLSVSTERRLCECS